MSFIKQILHYLNPFGGVNALADAFKGTLSSNLKSIGEGVGNAADSFVDKNLGTGLTPAEKEANEFTHNERIQAQDWTAQREDTYYQRTMADMAAAGINPLMAAGGSAGTSSSSGGSSVSPQSGSLSDLLAIVTLKPQIELMKAQADNLKAGAEEKRAKAPYWTQRIEESIQKIESMKAGAEKDISLKLLNDAKTKTETDLRQYHADLLVSERALADAQAALAQDQSDEVKARKALEAAQAAYQQALNDEDMAQKVCAKIVAETNLAGAQSSTQEQQAIATKLANAMVRGDFVEVCTEMLRENGHNEVNAGHVASVALAIFKNILGTVSAAIKL